MEKLNHNNFFEVLANEDRKFHNTMQVGLALLSEAYVKFVKDELYAQYKQVVQNGIEALLKKGELKEWT